MSKENKLIPELRFPEFVNEGEWEEKELGKVALFVNEKTPLKNLSTNSYISTENLLSNYDGVTSTSKLPSSGNFTKYRKGDVLISNIRPYLKKVWFSDKEGACSNDVFVVRANEISELFLSFLLKNDDFINYIMVGAKGVKMPRGDRDLMEKYPIYFPKNIAEQQKIASCLSSLDEVIAAHGQKLDALKDHKKSLMQNLFPQEGETVPKWRFSEFVGDGEWKNGKLGNLIDTLMGNAFKSEDFVEKGIQLVRMGNLYQGELQLNRSPAFLPIRFEDEHSKFLIKPLDILMSMTGTIGKRDYGFVIQIPQKSPKLLLNQRVLKIIPKTNCVKEFILQLLRDEKFLDKLYSLPGGTKQANLSVNQLIGITVSFPTPKEQQKIAECLSSLDELINAQGEQIAALKLHKKGLMQGLFPKTES